MPGFNKYYLSITKEPSPWDITKERDLITGVYMYRVRCVVCGALVLHYKDGAKLKPKKIEHCEHSDTFYIAEEIV